VWLAQHEPLVKIGFEPLLKNMRLFQGFGHNVGIIFPLIFVGFGHT
jgi:hypothetical protein